MMNLHEIIEKNKDFNQWKTDIEKQIKEKQAKLQVLNNEIDIEEFTKLPYIEAKEIFNALKYNLERDTKRKEIENVLLKMKRRDYPILNKAHHYPIINEIDFLNDEQKNELDYVMYQFYDGYVMEGSSTWKDLGYDNETTDRILKFLYDNKVLEKVYKLKCRCGSYECHGKIVTEERYRQFVEYHSITNEQIDNMSDKEVGEYEDDWGLGYFEVGCWNDGGYEVCNMSDWEKARKEVWYKNNTKPDMTYAIL